MKRGSGWVLNLALSKTWWLLALCGVLDALQAAMNLLTLNPFLDLRRFALPDPVWEMGAVALAAAACAFGAGVWSAGRGNAWLLALHGLALAAFGAIAVSPLPRGPLSFRPVSLLFTVMAASVGAFALAAAKTQSRGVRGRWLLIAAGAAFIGFSFSFIAVGFGLVRLGPPPAYFIWMGSYFAFCAIFMLWLAFHLHHRGPARSDHAEPFSRLPIPRHAR